jgi:uncharacterized delta-60 repeat protein
MLIERARGGRAWRTEVRAARRSIPIRQAIYLVEMLERRVLLSGTAGQIFVSNQQGGTIGQYTTDGAAVNQALVSGLDRPGSIAVSGSDLFVVNEGSDTIGEYTTSGATVNALLIDGLSDVNGIAVSGSDLFVADSLAGTISEYTTSGAPVNLSLVSGLAEPVNIAASGSDLFVANFAGNVHGAATIGEYATSGTPVNPALITGLSFPSVAVSGSDLFVCNLNEIGEYTTAGATVDGSLVVEPVGDASIAVLGPDLFVANYGSTISEFTTSGAAVNDALVSGLDYPDGICVEAAQPAGAATQLVFGQQAGNVTTGVPISPAITVAIEDQNGDLVSSDDSNVTLSIANGPPGASLSGTATIAAVDGVATFDDVLFNTPGTYALSAADAADGLAAFTSEPFVITPAMSAGAGEVFVTNLLNRTGEYTTSGATVNPSLVAGLSGPYGIAAAGSDLFVTNYGDGSDGTVGEYTTSGATVNAALVSGLTGPGDIAVSGSDLFVMNGLFDGSDFGTIGEYTTAGATVNASLISGFGSPVAIAVSGSDLFVANSQGTIGEYTTSGATVNASLLTGLTGLEGMAISGSDLFVTNAVAGTIAEYATSGATVNASLVSGLIDPARIAVTGPLLFVVNTGDNTIGEYTTSGAAVNASLLSGLNGPEGIVVEFPGSPDPTFNGGNPVGIGFAAQASATLADGSVLLAGLGPGASAGGTQAVLERLNAAGSFDASFGSAGIVTDSATSDEAFYGAATEPDGTIVAAGTSSGHLLLAGYDPDGTVDASFGAGGLVTVTVADDNDATGFDVTTDANGNLVVVGSAGGQFLADRFTAAGAQDATFNGGAPLVFGDASEGDLLGKVVVQGNGGIVAAGASDGSVVVVRLTPAGALDPTFGAAGIVTPSGLAAPDLLQGQPDHTEGLTIDSEGRILVANTTPGGEFATARLTGTGVLDATFGAGGVVTTSFGSGTADADFVAVQPDGSQVLVAGTYTLDGIIQQAIAAYTPQGRLDTTFGDKGMGLQSTGLSVAPALAQPSGQIAPQALGLAGLYIEEIFGNLESGELLLGVGQQSSTTASAAVQRFIAPAPTSASLPVGTLGVSVSASLPVAVIGGAKTNASALVTITNPTSQTIAGPASVTLLASLGQSLGSAVQLLAVSEKLNLKAHAHKAVRIRLSSFPSLPKGSYYLIATVKAPDNTVTGASVATPSLSIAPAFVTVKTSNVLGSPASIASGKKPTLSLTLQNNGNVPAAGTAPLTISLSPTSTGASGTTVATTPLPVKLKAGKSGIYRMKFTVPAGTAAGSYYLAASLAVSALGDTVAADGMAVSSMPISVT